MKIDIKDLEKYDKIVDENGKEVYSILDLSFLASNDFYNYRFGYKNGDIGGTMPKTFLRCDSKYFKHLFEELKKPNCSYYTYFNDVVTSDTDTNNLPVKKISVLIKKSHYQSNWAMDEIASRIANILSVPTVYNQAINIGSNDYTLSVDFSKEDERLLLLSELIENKPCKFLDTYFQSFYVSLFMFSTNFPCVMNLDKFNSLIEDFLPIYMFRKYIATDNDFVGDNVGLIYNEKTKSLKWAPCFDMEFAFFCTQAPSDLDEDLKEINYLMPEKLNELVEHYSNVLKSNALETELKTSLGSEATASFSMVTKLRLKKIVESYKQIKKPKRKEKSDNKHSQLKMDLDL